MDHIVVSGRNIVYSFRCRNQAIVRGCPWSRQLISDQFYEVYTVSTMNPLGEAARYSPDQCMCSRIGLPETSLRSVSRLLGGIPSFEAMRTSVGLYTAAIEHLACVRRIGLYCTRS